MRHRTSTVWRLLASEVPHPGSIGVPRPTHVAQLRAGTCSQHALLRPYGLDAGVWVVCAGGREQEPLHPCHAHTPMTGARCLFRRADGGVRAAGPRDDRGAPCHDQRLHGPVHVRRRRQPGRAELPARRGTGSPDWIPRLPVTPGGVILASGPHVSAWRKGANAQWPRCSESPWTC